MQPLRLELARNVYTKIYKQGRGSETPAAVTTVTGELEEPKEDRNGGLEFEPGHSRFSNGYEIRLLIELTGYAMHPANVLPGDRPALLGS